MGLMGCPFGACFCLWFSLDARYTLQRIVVIASTPDTAQDVPVPSLLAYFWLCNNVGAGCQEGSGVNIPE
jgi:hypothetical protein